MSSGLHEAAAPSSVPRSALVRLTVAKSAANTALRWIPPFLPTLERAFGATTSQLTTIMGIGEMAGLSTVAVGKRLDRGHERAVMVTSLGAVSVSSLIALAGSTSAFALAFLVLVLGVANFTVAGHAWISHRVDYRWRARSIGLFEISWALALLVGAPIVAVLITTVGWRGPFLAVGVATAAAAVLTAVTVPAGEPPSSRDEPPRGAPVAVPAAAPLTATAWLVVVGSATTAMAGLSVFVVSGAWLDDAFGVPTGGLGAVAMGFGAVELLASASSAGFADRIGKRRSTVAALLLLAVGLTLMANAGGTLAIGVIGLLTMLVGFEYAFVTSLSLVSEAMPEARGRTLAIGNGVGTAARGSGAIASGWLYDAHGIAGTVTLSATATVVAFTCFVSSGRRSPRRALRGTG